jgi:uncharacterized protein YdhG (YjbR/CyaY superfamily)
MAKMEKVETIAEYIATIPTEHQGKLAELRQIIKSAVPDVEEGISYNMPTYTAHGKLMHFAFWKEHVGIYGIVNPVIDQFTEEIGKYLAEKGTLQFPLDEELPKALIEKLIKAQAKYKQSNPE